MKKSKAKFSEYFYRRLLKICCLIIVTISVILIPILFTIIHGYVNKNIVSMEKTQVSKTATQVEDYLEQASNIAAYSSNLTSIPISELSDSNSYWHKKIIEDNISANINTCPFVSKIILDNGNGEIYSSSNDLESQSTKLIAKYKSNKLYIPETPSWPYNIKLVYSLRTSGKQSVSVFLNSAYISEKFFNEYTFLVDSNNTIVLANNIANQGKQISELYPNIKNFDIDKSNSSSKYYIHTQKIMDSDLSIVSFVSKKEFFSQFLLIFLLCVVSIAILMTVILVIIINIMSAIYKPIRDITETFKYHIPFDEEKFENEISYINYSISHTLDSNKQLSEDANQLIETAKLSQVKAVYSQISPHFISNTLDNIKWQSIFALGCGNKIETSIVLLNNIISECMHQNNMITTILKEVEITKNYTELMQQRYENLFDVIWEIPEEISDALIIKLSLQPLIENSIMHSFDPNKKGQYVKIKFEKTDNKCITATISDNGKGIDSAMLKSIRQSLLDHEPAQKHIGIKNIHIRYQILYGEEFGISNIKSNENGTTIVLRIPL